MSGDRWRVGSEARIILAGLLLLLEMKANEWSAVPSTAAEHKLKVAQLQQGRSQLVCSIYFLHAS
jgi:hypothetical protein